MSGNLVFPRPFFFVKRSDNPSTQQEGRLPEALPRMYHGNWVLNRSCRLWKSIKLDVERLTTLFLQQILTSWLVGNSAYPEKSKQVFRSSISLQGEQKHWRRRKGNTKFIISYLWIWREKESILSSFFHALIIFCSSSPPPQKRLGKYLASSLAS